jgi:hypothetical protein
MKGHFMPLYSCLPTYSYYKSRDGILIFAEEKGKNTLKGICLEAPRIERVGPCNYPGEYGEWVKDAFIKVDAKIHVLGLPFPVYKTAILHLR